MSIAGRMSFQGSNVSPSSDTIRQAVTSPAAATARRRVLVIEDEAPIRELVRLHLALDGFDVTEVADGGRALELARGTRFDLIVLDVMLPGIDGISLCRAMRADGVNKNASILMLTARDTESDKVLGLESGADDYLAKPFGMRELLARVGAILRRSARGAGPAETADSHQLRARDLVLDSDRRELLVRGTRVELTKQEFDLLYLLAARPGIVFSREALLAKVWGGDTYVTERTVDTVVSRIRRKIERDAQDPELILTAWGVGYKFVDAD
jgi:two-component system alkaline phosphatase synthesis response regulator PhoP